MNYKVWIKSARLRTLPLSLSAVILGIGIGVDQSVLGIKLIPETFFIIVTALLLQILSNYANDYGDHESGVDTIDRKGPIRPLQKGIISISQMKLAIIFTVIASIFFGCLTIFFSFGFDIENVIYFIILGFLALVAAISYTIGISYGYKGLGDLFVFIFFGLVAVVGSSYLISHTILLSAIILGINAGLMAILVLNVNNLRDFETDRINGKNSIVVYLGIKNGKRYHLLILLSAVITACTYTYMQYGWFFLLTLAVFIPLIKTSYFCIKLKNQGKVLNSKLKTTSLSSCLINMYFFVLILLN